MTLQLIVAFVSGGRSRIPCRNDNGTSDEACNEAAPRKLHYRACYCSGPSSRVVDLLKVDASSTLAIKSGERGTAKNVLLSQEPRRSAHWRFGQCQPSGGFRHYYSHAKRRRMLVHPRCSVWSLTLRLVEPQPISW